jgi:hypothetical protein
VIRCRRLAALGSFYQFGCAKQDTIGTNSDSDESKGLSKMKGNFHPRMYGPSKWFVPCVAEIESENVLHLQRIRLQVARSIHYGVHASPGKLQDLLLIQRCRLSLWCSLAGGDGCRNFAIERFSNLQKSCHAGTLYNVLLVSRRPLLRLPKSLTKRNLVLRVCRQRQQVTRTDKNDPQKDMKPRSNTTDD